MPKDTILYRLAMILAERNDWPISEHPRGGYDLNYDITYIDYAQRFTDWRQTPWAAYFSHYEEGTSYKEYWWNTANDGMRIKTVTADQYGAILSGKVIKTPAPVDPIFVPIDRKPNKIPKIGISVFVDKSGRKGEKLLARLAYDLEGKADFSGSGRGWPVKTQVHKFNDLPAWYNSLDYLVCTSLIEGVPMPPLEALACGVPVIIPSGVGMLDELTGPGVYRYAAGDYDSLLLTAIAALDSDKPDREAMALSVGIYNPGNYAEAHVKGFE